MPGSFEKSVKGATKIKAAPPKTKYIEHLLIATHAGEGGVAEVFRTLLPRLRDSTWTVVFKSLITVHLMIREGAQDATLAYLAKHKHTLAISMFSDAQTQGRNIRHYANYLSERARAYRDTKVDWARSTESRLEKLTVDKGLLRETEAVQHQLTALLKCDVLENEPENEITITVFRLLVLDLLVLYQTLNQAMINILGHFFEMAKSDAERALEVYHTFTKQTDFVVQYLSIARRYENHTKVEVPKLKHAPVNLGRQLEDYLKDSDFDTHRRQYLAEIQGKKSKGGSGAVKDAFSRDLPSKASSSAAFPDVPKPVTSEGVKKPAASKAPDPDLIDFFSSIEQNQTPLATQPNPQMHQQQQNAGSPWGPDIGYQQQQQQQQQQLAQQQQQQFQGGFIPQQTGFQQPNPYQQPDGSVYAQQQQQQQQQQPAPQQQPMYTGAGFGGFTPQPSFQAGALGSIPQDNVASFQQNPMSLAPQATGQQVTNPFRQSMMATGQQPMPTGSSFGASPAFLQPQSTNPFARSSVASPPVFASPTGNGSPFQSPPPGAPPPNQQLAPLQPMATGTNPFAKNYGAAAQPTLGQIQEQPSFQQSPPPIGQIMPQATGSNPFRQGAFVNHQTGQGWQQNQQVMGGGLDHLQTIPVFPRPVQQSPWQQ